MLCWGVYRFRDSQFGTQKIVTPSNKRYVICNPSADFRLMPTDLIYVLEQFNPNPPSTDKIRQINNQPQNVNINHNNNLNIHSSKSSMQKQFSLKNPNVRRSSSKGNIKRQSYYSSFKKKSFDSESKNSYKNYEIRDKDSVSLHQNQSSSDGNKLGKSYSSNHIMINEKLNESTF